MSLLKLCQKITNNVSNILPSGHRLEHRLACPEYSKSAQEVKTYPLLNEERIFALCWNFSVPNTLHATLVPAPKAFCCRLKITENEMTQLHTHDYIELAYIIEGTFRQKILGKDISFHKGELCLIDKNCLHQDYLENQNAVILFLGIANDMFKEIMDENITTQKIIAFLQSALLEQKICNNTCISGLSMTMQSQKQSSVFSHFLQNLRNIRLAVTISAKGSFSAFSEP